MIGIALEFSTGGLARWAKAVQDHQEQRLKQRLAQAAMEIHKNVVLLIQKQSNGGAVKRYYRGRKPKIVVVSKPGEAPNSDTGALIRSYRFRIDTASKSATVGSSSPYAAPLELGSRFIEARPHLQPAFDAYVAGVKKTFKKNKVEVE